jgi:hypothetical protein
VLISPSDEDCVFIVPIHAAALVLPEGKQAKQRLECAPIFSGVHMEKQAGRTIQPCHLSMPATFLNGQKQCETWELQNLY